MVNVDSSLWTVLNVVGMILLAAGALSIMLVMQPQTDISAAYIAAGAVLITISSLFISLDGRKLRKEDEEYRRFEKIRDDARMVPNDLKEGYLIDYSAANPDDAISYRNNGPEQTHEEISEDQSDDDVLIIYSN